MPSSMTEYIDQLLSEVLITGLRESDFWDMTIGEVGRYAEGWNKMEVRRQQEKASFDYIQAQLIASNVAKILGGKHQIPTLAETYPELFKDELEQERRNEQSIARFLAFANRHNANFVCKEGIANG